MMRQFTAAVALVVGLSASVWAQEGPSATFSPQSNEYPGNTRPLAEPGIFDYDGQMFAPVEFNNFEERAPNTGFYFTVDRIYNSISRGGERDNPGQNAPTNATPGGSDWQWGNRYNAGWMTDADSGWEAIYEYSTGSFFAAGSDVLVSNPMMVTTRYSNFELNKTFRQHIQRGGYFEPYVGMRYLGLTDKTIEDVNLTIGGAQAGNRFKQQATNSAFGGHVGGRYNTNRGRFRYTADGALATMYNRQRYSGMDLLFQGTSVSTNEFNDSHTSFVPVLDTRFEVAYAITRDIGLRGGVQLQYMWQGMARSDNRTTAINPNSAFGAGGGQTGVFSESATVAGFSMGIEWKR